MTDPVLSDRAFAKFLGKEIRRARETRGWTRAQMVERLPSGITDRALLSYEHGLRFPSVPRFAEICRVLGAAGSEVLRRAEVASGDLSRHALTVNMWAVRKDSTGGFGAVAEWARRRMRTGDGQFLRLEPASVRELAAAFDLEHEVLAAYLAEFSVDDGG